MSHSNTFYNYKLLENGINRRDFLKVAGLAAGALAASGLPLAMEGRSLGAPLASSAGFRGALKVGVLLPTSHRYPGLADNLMDGMLAAAKGGGLSLT